MQKEINDVSEAIQKAKTELVKFANEIREIKWDRFDYLQDRIEAITSDAEFLIDLMDHTDLYDEVGQLTDTGVATMGLHGQNYNVYMAQADKYAKEIRKLNKEIANDPQNTKLLERRQELLEAQRDFILAAEDEKDAIVDMVREGIDIELEALQDLIDKYEESLDSAKDLYDYQKKVKEQTSEIAKLQKQLSAYAGDTSEENRARIQKLTVDLSDAMEDLEETQYEHYISESKKMLDNLYDEYERILNERLDNIDVLIGDMIDAVNVNSGNILTTLEAQSKEVGYTITENEKAIWSNEGNAAVIISKYGDKVAGVVDTHGGMLFQKLTSVGYVIDKIAFKEIVNAAKSESTAQKTISSTASQTIADKSVKPAATATSNPVKTPTNTNTNSNNRAFNDAIKKGIAWAIWVKGGPKSGWGDGSDRKKRLTEKFGAASAKATQDYINKNLDNLYNSWVKAGKPSLTNYYYSAFKHGGLADYTGPAWIDGTPTEPEMVLDAKDTENFIALKDAMRSIANGDNALATLFGGNGTASKLIENLGAFQAPGINSGSSIGDVTYQINIPIDHVEDYEDFVNKLRADGRFEKMIQSMTVDRLVGGSRLSKNKYQW